MRVSLFSISLVGLLLLSGCAGRSANDSEMSATDGSTTAVSATSSDSAGAEIEAEVADVDLATNFTMTTLSGEEVSLESLRGRHVLVNFWATWCVPCREEMPYLQAISDDHAEQIVVLGVNLGEDTKRIQPFVDEMKLTFPILLDPPDALLAEHNVRGLPVSYVVGPEGAIVYRQIGEILPEKFDPWLDENLLADAK